VSVDPAITRLILEEEVQGMASLAEAYGWEVIPDLNALTVSVRMSSIIDQQVFIVEARCDDYKEMPPYFEFIHPDTGERGTKRCYPAGSNYFHSMPCICVQWNRKAYKRESGPHADWNIANWIQARRGTETLGDMFHLVQKEINQRGKYRGRMA
jgi:hypothetical protein